MAELLVTGGAGFIGSHFVGYWRDRHPSAGVTVLDALTYAGRRENLAGIPAIDFIEGDIRDGQLVEDILIERNIDTIVHLAAETHVDRSIASPDAFVEANLLGTQRLLEAARRAWIDRGSGCPHRFHHVSTDEVYGSLGSSDPPFTETSPLAPNSPYAASKAGSDHLVRAYQQTFGLQASISRCSNNFGIRQYPEKLIPFFIDRSLRGLSLPVYGDGGNVRDWVHVHDHCEGIERIILTGAAGEIYNLGGGDEWSNLDLVDQLCAALDGLFAHSPRFRSSFAWAPGANGIPFGSLVTHVADRPGHDRRYALDHGKARATLGYQPGLAIKNTLSDVVRWYVEQAIAS